MLVILVLLSATTLAAAQEAARPMEADEASETSEAPNAAGAMLVDAFLLRPLGFAATVLGTATFLVTLPFSLPTRSADDAAKALVVKPAKYTFARPLGKVEP
jgi:hypothetical protein